MTDLRASLGALPPRFHLGAVTEGVPLSSLIATPEQVRAWIDADSAKCGAPDAQVGASMLVQHVSIVLGGATMASALLHGTLPLATAERVLVSPSPASRWGFALDTDEFVEGEPSELLTAWVQHWHDGVLGGIVEAVHRSVRVGRRMLADNVAAAAASNLVFLDWWHPEAGFDRLAPLLASLGDPRIGDATTFSTIRHGDRDGLKADRRSCCLYHQCLPPHWCPSCPKISEAEREQSMRTHLGHMDAALAARRQGALPTDPPHRRP